jgi:hypothetical protein
MKRDKIDKKIIKEFQIKYKKFIILNKENKNGIEIYDWFIKNQNKNLTN